ncbi:nicotinate-nucleotide--dimethylbenzimidazole phosphoribosyltransferase [Prochlorococcus sp. MIT 1223]|uniref:nicotinate-nucleotide--dimethylbenzimidazole phosphoribosyltransferase n=1 Tax=Prochlorococcus sp. MIT 1223 TaxID=3096217 RepID=UPI002A752745|nr:nicotinate-nucleotide--dimethylbenzimidazole phosphoribosyltransferase [Prochlorococcus sp. MIT 1223]
MKSQFFELLSGNKAFGVGLSLDQVKNFQEKWKKSLDDFVFLLILAGSKTSEVEGISWAGSTPQSRSYTALADADLVLKGPLKSRKWPLPVLPGGVSPALISYVSSCFIGTKPTVIAAGLLHKPTFPHLLLEPSFSGPADCLSSGKAMSKSRVDQLWQEGFSMGVRLKTPLLITECVPGGTTTAQAILCGIGIEVSELISGSVLIPPFSLKKELVRKGLENAALGPNPLPKKLLAAVGDPFQVIAVGLVLGAREAKQPVLLGGGSQMLAVLALALASIEPELRFSFVENIAIATTSWLVKESHSGNKFNSSFIRLMELVSDYFGVCLMGFSSGLSFEESTKKVLRDYELGYVKEGVGAGALSFLAKMKGVTSAQLVQACDLAVEQLESTHH